MKQHYNPLGAWALVSLLLLATVTGCSGASVAQDIVNWTPTIVSTATTVGSVVASLDPADAALIAVSVTGFNAAANLLSSQAQVYLNNPNATTLQQLQAQVLTFQQNVNTALLQAAKIVSPGSQQKVIAAIQSLATGLTAVLALIATIKGNTLSPASVTAPVKLSQVAPLINHQQEVAMVAAHYNESSRDAEIDVRWAHARLAYIGL